MTLKDGIWEYIVAKQHHLSNDLVVFYNNCHRRNLDYVDCLDLIIIRAKIEAYNRFIDDLIRILERF